MRPYCPICLVRPGQPDRFLRLTFAQRNVAELEHEGILFRRSQRRTHGGWPIFIEVR